MNIKLNGINIKSRELSLMELVLDQGLDPVSLIAEVNFKVIRKDVWESMILKDGDVIELLNFVGGG